MKEKIAVVGIGCIFPDAPTFTDYWKNIVEGKNSVKDISGKFWRKEDFYDSDMFAEDKFYTTTGAYVDPIEFDTLEFGIPPKMLESTSVEQLFALIVAKQALMDAGMYGEDAKEAERMRTGVIISSGLGSNGFTLCHRTEAPKIRKLLINNGVPEKIADKIVRKYKDTLPDWDKDCTPGFISNVVAGRISNRFNLGGITASVDAACGSSLGSIKFAVDELRNGSCDCMLAGGINLSLSSHSYMMFCKTPAIAKSGMIKPFDESADGMILGDGAGIVVLKRLEDAKRDGNKIYAVICDVGASSDARARSIYAPSKKGQIRCLNNAYSQSGVGKETIGLIEAHGTGTVAGDTCEVQALSSLFATDSKERNIILGSVKSQIGHLRLAAGISGFIKTAIALHEKVLPASINVSKINKEVLNSNLCVLKKPKAWIVNDLQPVRRAGVSAFGFGGTNFHVVLEEAETEHQTPYRLTPTALVIAFSAPSMQELSDKISAFRSEISEDKYALFNEKYNTKNAGFEECRVSFTAVSCEDALKKSETALEMLKSENTAVSSKQNIYFSKVNTADSQKTAVLFAGQGTQQVDMLSEIAMRYPEMREAITTADNIMIAQNSRPVSKLVYPYWQTEEERTAYEEELKNTKNTQPVLASLSLGLIKILEKRGIEGKYFIGHSFGELPALRASGAFDDETLIKSAIARGKFMQDCGSDDSVPLSMLAVMADKSTTETYIKEFSNIYIGNENSPLQTVVSGELEQLKQLAERLSKDGIKSTQLKVSSAFHSPYMKKASEAFRNYLNEQTFGTFNGNVIANCTADVYTENIPEILEKQLVTPVRFTESIQKAYELGVRVFIEAGNGKVLSNLVRKILGDKEYYIVPLVPDKNADSCVQLEEAMAQLYALGFKVKPDSYGLVPDKRFDNTKKTKTSYTIHSNEFFLPEKAERIKNALESVEKYETPVKPASPVIQKVEQPAEVKKERTPMSNMYTENTIINESNNNAEVMKQFMELQKTQLDSMVRLVENSSSKTETEQKNIFDCVAMFQNNSMKALEFYFNNANTTEVLPKSAPVVTREEIPAVNVPEKPVVQAVKTPEPAVVPEQTKAPVSESKTFDVHGLIIRTISETTGFPSDMITLDMELENDLGVDSIQKVEIFSTINEKLGNVFNQESIGELAELLKISEIEEYLSKLVASGNKETSVSEEKPAVSDNQNASDLKAVITKIVSESTGFPEDMIMPDMNLESDLGVDSIKVVEIFSELSEKLSCEFNTKEFSSLSTLKTINEISEYLSKKI